MFAAFVTPLQERVAGYLADPAQLDAILADGARRAAEVADVTVRTVFDRVGFLAAT